MKEFMQVFTIIEIKLKAKRIVVLGEVQYVGYRRRVLSTARRLGLKGYVKNRSDGSVEVIAAGDSASVKNFIEGIKINDPPIIVDSIDVKDVQIRRTFRDFRIVSGSFVEELQEGLGAGETQLNLFRREFGDYREEFRGFGGRTDENFRVLETKYGEISENFCKVSSINVSESEATRKELVRAVDALVELIRSKLDKN
jgi:acylphosphatase